MSNTELLTTEKTTSNRVKLYGIIIGIVTLILQHAIYLLGNEIAGLIGIEAFLPKIVAIDDAIPVIPIFIIPYVWAYAFWGMAPMAASKCSKEHFLDSLAAYMFACLFGMLILIFAPTYMDRVAEGIYNYPKNDFFSNLMKFWYGLDGGERAYNLLPSFHCINSTISYLIVAKRPEIPRWFRIYSLITAILIFAATLFVKQHFILDVFSGIAVAVIAFALTKKFKLGRIFNKPIELHNKLFGNIRAKR